MPRPAKNIFTEKWMREFKEMVRKEQAASSKHQASSRKRKPKPEPSSGSEAASSKLQASSNKQQA
jgi:Sec-independent protein translocase protein TatA